jgi:hypothetical protein
MMGHKITKTALAASMFLAFSGAAAAQTQSVEVPAPERMDILELSRNMDCGTHDGYGVSVINMHADGLYNTFNVRFGNADYVEGFGYRTFLDVANLQDASPQLQAFIAAHECAHHSLGHSYEAYDNGFVAQDRHHRYERQADCEAIRRIALDYGYRGRETVAAIFDELALVNEQIIRGLPIEAEEMATLLNDLPARSASRKADGMSCPIY